MVNTRQRSYRDGEKPPEITPVGPTGEPRTPRPTRARNASSTSEPDNPIRATGTRNASFTEPATPTRRSRAVSLPSECESPARTKRAKVLPDTSEAETPVRTTRRRTSSATFDSQSAPQDVTASPSSRHRRSSAGSPSPSSAQPHRRPLLKRNKVEEEERLPTVAEEEKEGDGTVEKGMEDASKTTHVADVSEIESDSRCKVNEAEATDDPSEGANVSPSEENETDRRRDREDVEPNTDGSTTKKRDVNMADTVAEDTENKGHRAVNGDGGSESTRSKMKSSDKASNETALSAAKLADIQDILDAAPVKPNLDDHPTVKASEKPPTTETFTRIKCPQVPRGKPKSGRFWKPLHTKMSLAIVRDRDSYEVRMKKLQQVKAAKDLEKQIRAEHKVKMQDLRKRREYNTKKAAENALKAEVYQVVKNPNKIKRMKKKQLRQLTTRDTTVVGKSVLDD